MAPTDTQKEIPVTESAKSEIPNPEIPAEKIEVQLVSADDLVNPLAATMPEPTAQGTTPTAPNSSPDGAAIPRAEIKDKRGTKFDPSRHAVDANGNPRFNIRGNFISNSIGRPSGKSSGETPGKDNPEKQIPDSEQPDAKPLLTDFTNGGKPDEYTLAAEMYLGMGYALASGIISDEWQPEGTDEHNSLKIPLAAYMRSTGVIELTPKQALTIAIIAYAGKRMTKPKTKERLIVIWVKIKSLFSRGPKVVESKP